MKERIIDILSETRPEFDFTCSENFIDDGLLDSFDLISLVTSLEQEFGFSIDGVDMTPENFKNLSAIESLLRRYLGI